MSTSRLPLIRRIVQFLSLGALNSNFINSAVLKGWCLPVMNCDACMLAWLGCPIGLIRGPLTLHEFPWIPLAIALGIGLLVGRFFCGWICPIGLLQDLLHKIPSRKFPVPRWTTWIKYGVLVGSVFAVAWFLGGESPWFFCEYCPTAGVQAVLPAAIQERNVAKLFEQPAKFIATLAMLLGAVALSRPFCKVLCPVGALVAITNKIMPWKLHLKASSCIRCKKCERGCPMDLPVVSHQDAAVTRDTECILCHACQDACPVNAIEHRALGRGTPN
ncbi:MAG: 4Fe-4S binding protein [Kiritimatiellia bacterium]|jgi:ferredoxin-type protein NapH